MANALLERLRQGQRTSHYPDAPAALPERFRGRPQLDGARCAQGCRACADACPVSAVSIPLRVDLGACVFCGVCEEACAAGALKWTPDHRLAARGRAELVASPGSAPSPVTPLAPGLRRLLSRSLKLRQVSAGGCSGCEAELVALGNVVFDLGRFGIQFVASPRHADGIVITGPVTANMELALRETYAAVPDPKIVIAVGACAIAGGPFAGGSIRGIPQDIPVHLYVPGCPPHPLTFLDGVLRLLGRPPREGGTAQQ